MHPSPAKLQIPGLDEHGVLHPGPGVGVGVPVGGGTHVPVDPQTVHPSPDRLQMPGLDEHGVLHPGPGVGVLEGPPPGGVGVAVG